MRKPLLLAAAGVVACLIGVGGDVATGKATNYEGSVQVKLLSFNANNEVSFFLIAR